MEDSRKFTRGPWKQGDYILWPAHGGNAQFPIHAPKRGRIALALAKEADARLISAAPDLYDAADNALNALLACCVPAGGVDDRKTILEAQAMLRAALSKATGA